MKHKQSQRSIGRKLHHRQALLKNLSSSLLEHRSIITTETKAKELKKYLEPLITQAKRELSLSLRRQLLKKLLKPENIEDIVEIAENNKTRQGGYLRVSKMPSPRSDGSTMIKIDILE